MSGALAGFAGIGRIAGAITAIITAWRFFTSRRDHIDLGAQTQKNLDQESAIAAQKRMAQVDAKPKGRDQTIKAAEDGTF